MFQSGTIRCKGNIHFHKTLKATKGIVFIVLNLKNSSGKVVSHNVYWISSDGDYKTMNDMEKTSLNVSVVKYAKEKNDTKWIIQITNTTGKMAFFIRPQLLSSR